jgi:hypothetical protein
LFSNPRALFWLPLLPGLQAAQQTDLARMVNVMKSHSEEEPRRGLSSLPRQIINQCLAQLPVLNFEQGKIISPRLLA